MLSSKWVLYLVTICGYKEELFTWVNFNWWSLVKEGVGRQFWEGDLMMFFAQFKCLLLLHYAQARFLRGGGEFPWQVLVIRLELHAAQVLVITSTNAAVFSWDHIRPKNHAWVGKANSTNYTFLGHLLRCAFTSDKHCLWQYHFSCKAGGFK